MTERLYHADATLAHCEAIVRACRKAKEGEAYEVLLDKTVIFPLSGGQLSDKGSIAGAEVSFAREEGEEVWHVVDRALEEGASVEVHTDMQLRMDHTRQHTGEHIFSGLAASLYGARNVGFHMAEDYVTVDFDRFLSTEELEALERACNRAVQANLPITCEVVAEDALAGLTLRKQAEDLVGEIRIVYIQDVDSCTCCGTHCAHSGEVGYIRVARAARHKGGVRVWIDCGGRAVEAALLQNRIVEGLARRFSTAQENVAVALEKQQREFGELKLTLKHKTEAFVALKSETLLAGAPEIRGVKLVIDTARAFTANDLKLLAEALLRERVIAVLFSQTGDALLYQVSCFSGCKLSMREVCEAVNLCVGGKGGGREESAHGFAPKVPAGFEICVERIHSYLGTAIKANYA